MSYAFLCFSGEIVVCSAPDQEAFVYGSHSLVSFLRVTKLGLRKKSARDERG